MPTLASRTTETILEDDPLQDFHVFENEIRSHTLAAFLQCLDNGASEREAQRFLEENPEVLAQHLGGGHGRWVIPHQRLGSELITDFVIGERNSGGTFWHAVELESPKARMFSRNGDPSAKLNHAIRQITDWRAWLDRNQNYAARPRSESGLGLTDIHSQVHGIIIIGRRDSIEPGTNDRRRQLCADSNIQIMSYDRLIEWAQTRCDHWENWYRSLRECIIQ